MSMSPLLSSFNILRNVERSSLITMSRSLRSTTDCSIFLMTSSARFWSSAPSCLSPRGLGHEHSFPMRKISAANKTVCWIEEQVPFFFSWSFLLLRAGIELLSNPTSKMKHSGNKNSVAVFFPIFISRYRCDDFCHEEQLFLKFLL